MRPITFPLVDWSTYSKVVKDALQINPAAGLDKLGLDLNDPVSFLASLPLDNNPMQALNEGIEATSIYKHINMTCIDTLQDSTVAKIPTVISCHMLNYDMARFQKLVIVTANLEDWIRGILRACQIDSDMDLRKSFSELFLILNGTSFRHSFSMYEKILLRDGTYELRRS